ncbi:ZIP family metal transporter [Bacillus cereus group sp. BfR-BA-01380]|uniref:ZIP family metal transporter n=1 Tax=Bacillus cereus group sp. BfR-BA-01380 TaxID=2920324 RepID=UPI001F5871EC|nr:ZIP family metal transporter [Bacillus cereus group sp. BfR-BA-01380]
MEQLLLPMIVTFYSFIGLLLGGIVGLTTRRIMEEQTFRLYALCGGILLALLLIEIIPETFSSYEIIGPLLGCTIGILMMRLIDHYCHHVVIHKNNQQTWQTFLFLSFAIFIHNLPSGFALGTAFTTHHESTLSFLLAIVIHHIPEGLALTISFLFTQHKYISFILVILLLSIILGLSTAFGMIINSKTIHLPGLIMGSAIGSLGYVTVHEMLWKAKKNLSLLSFLSWTFIGCLLIIVFIPFISHH